MAIIKPFLPPQNLPSLVNTEGSPSNGIPSNGINEALRSMGLRSDKSEDDVKDLLELNGLGIKAIIEKMGMIADNTTSEPLRMRALENAAKMHGMMKPPDNGNVTNVKLIIYSPEIKGESAYQTVEV